GATGRWDVGSLSYMTSPLAQELRLRQSSQGGRPGAGARSILRLATPIEQHAVALLVDLPTRVRGEGRRPVPFATGPLDDSEATARRRAALRPRLEPADIAPPQHPWRRRASRGGIRVYPRGCGGARTSRSGRA